MMNLIRNPAPTYKGGAQPPQDGSGLLSRILCYLFGGGTPAYVGKGQSVAKPCGLGVFPGTPVYRQPVVFVDDADPAPELDDSDGDEAKLDELSGEPCGEPYERTTGPITIVVR